MSIDNYIWAPAGVRENRNIPYRKYKAWKEMTAVENLAGTPHQVFLAHDVLIDEQYIFEAADDAWWFWITGYQDRLYIDNHGAPSSYDRMTLWIDGKEIDSRGYPDREPPITIV